MYYLPPEISSQVCSTSNRLLTSISSKNLIQLVTFTILFSQIYFLDLINLRGTPCCRDTESTNFNIRLLLSTLLYFLFPIKTFFTFNASVFIGLERANNKIAIESFMLLYFSIFIFVIVLFSFFYFIGITKREKIKNILFAISLLLPSSPRWRAWLASSSSSFLCVFQLSNFIIL